MNIRLVNPASNQLASFSLCYNALMVLKSDLASYRSRWKQVDRFIQKERQTASFELRWKQLNSAYAIAMGLGFSKNGHDDMKVFQTWAGLKEKASKQNRSF